MQCLMCVPCCPQAFLDAIDAVGRQGTLLIPAGRYLITKQLHINNRVVLRGEGPLRTLAVVAVRTAHMHVSLGRPAAKAAADSHWCSKAGSRLNNQSLRQQCLVLSAPHRSRPGQDPTSVPQASECYPWGGHVHLRPCLHTVQRGQLAECADVAGNRHCGEHL